MIQIWIVIILKIPCRKKNIGTLVSFLQKFGITSQCQESITTVHYVNACPRSAEKWTEAAERLNCQSISTNCTTFVYHCVMDHYRTTLIEVCAPKKLILGIYALVFFYLEMLVLWKKYISNKCFEKKGNLIHIFSRMHKNYNDSNLNYRNY